MTSGGNADPTAGPPELRVALDLTPLLGRATGIGVFTRTLLKTLARREDLATVGFAVTWRGRRELRRLIPPGVTMLTRPMPARPLRLAWARTDHPTLEAFGARVDLVHGTNYVVPPTRRAARLVTVHDLTPLHYPELCSRDTLAYPRLVQRAWQRGAWIHTDSQFVAEEVREWLKVRPVDAARVVPIHLGVSTPSDPPDRHHGDPLPGDPQAGQVLAGAGRYVLALGTIEPRKGLVDLVAAFDEVCAADDPGREPQDRVALVVAGPDGWGVHRFEEAVAACAHRNRIRRLGWVDDRQRADLLAGATVLAYPSLYEGFGFPPLEAMAAGVPVVCSDAGSLPEVTAGGARHVPQGDIGALAAALAELIGENQEATTRRTALVSAGRARAAELSWDRCTGAMVGLYRTMVGLG
ncbi:MAG: glycosyltransferase family 4 protein [Acidimicrobiales bacterium]